MSDSRLDVHEVTARLGVKRETVYAYVSRGLLHSQPSADGRTSTFDEAEVEALADRGRPRRRALPGEGIDVTLSSAITELRDGSVRYRRHNLVELTVGRSFETVAELLWTGRLPAEARWIAPDAAVAAARAALAVLPAAADAGDRLRCAVVAASAADPMRHDLRPDAVLQTGRGLIAAVCQALHEATSSRSNAHNATPIASHLARAIDPRLARRWHRSIEVALIALADHELATSTLAARIAASTRADPTQVVLAGLAVVSGPLHGTASVQAHRLLLDGVGDPMAAVVDHLRQRGHLPGFGHPIHRSGDPRTELVLRAVRQAGGARQAKRLAHVDAVLAVAAQRAPTAPNVDFALAAMAYVASLPVGSTELIFSVARMAGWLAHGLEEYGEEALRFRTRARVR